MWTSDGTLEPVESKMYSDLIAQIRGCHHMTGHMWQSYDFWRSIWVMLVCTCILSHAVHVLSLPQNQKV